MREVKIGGVYRHFKGRCYLVEDVAKHSETLEDYVIYRQLYGEGKRWIRPLGMFLERVDREKQLPSHSGYCIFASFKSCLSSI